MKKQLIILSVLLCTIAGKLAAQYPDLPGGGGSFNVQSIPAGSYVIAMDNMNQHQGSAANVNQQINITTGSTSAVLTADNLELYPGMTITANGVPAGTIVTTKVGTTIIMSNAATATATNRACTFGGFRFNLRAYGLLVTLLNNNKRLRWVMKPGKLKDAFDFSVNATMIRPSAGAAAVYNFSGGPFVIFAQDTAGVAALVQTFNGTASNDDVKVYRTNAAVNADIRYDYLINGVIWKPKGAILDDGGNANIHETYMTNAAMPAVNYTVQTTPSLLTGCFTFASEPHNESAPDATIQAIRTFVTNGGNFLAQCAAVRTYEASTFARFQSTNGFDNANENGAPAAWNYSNSDLAYFQVNGYFGIEDEGGSLKSWVIPTSPTNPPTNHFHAHNTGASGGRNYTNASVAKMITTSARGGMVFYLGSHNYDGNASFNINGQRMYLNAFLVPTSPQGILQSAAVLQCAGGATPVRVNCGSSSGPTTAYPLTFKLYVDNAPAGYGAEDVQQGNTVTFTAPNTASGSSVITGTTISYSNYVVVIQPASGCLQAKYVQISCSTLPVELLSFTAVRAGANVQLNWSTATEQNNKGFYIERLNSANGNWEDVNFIPSKAVNGTSTDQSHYAYTDRQASKTVSQYRIRQVDMDGKATYSEIRLVAGIGQQDNLVVFPNPSHNGAVTLLLNNGGKRFEISIADMSGRVIRQFSGVTANTVKIDNLLPGMYTVRLVTAETGAVQVQKIVIAK